MADCGFRRHCEYTFTDITTSFLADAESEFARYPRMSFGLIDIEKSPLEQGYNANYDLVVASQVLRAISVIAQTVKNCRDSLRTGGKMVLLELRSHNHRTGAWHVSGLLEKQRWASRWASR
jgi:SAM-dependent methyltransferase